ncbi:unnamed protein product [Spirodela intermedia]|uniref:HTH OST-type domain-containing protein n=1 Tax=Spirodela intermedia TaxID=51605 RepID=A0A7I8ISN6_SPIIN|nr:unnamed protein product [Spirodela intermedia]CAA6660540.1 unnamed protein product [Spirodela intermedia]
MRVGNGQGLLLSLYSPSRRSACSHVFLFRCGSGDEFRRWRTGNFSTSSSATNSYPSHSQWRHHDEESKSVKVAVWWDFENCSIPSGVNAFRVPHRITSALRAHGIRGPVSITAFGDVAQLSRSTQEALYTSGVCLNHVPNCGKNSSDRSLLADLVYWVAQNPPPVHFFLISGDGDFANILHRLRMNNYNILLASGDGASGALCSAATLMWQWNSLVRGDSLTGRHFNHSPDGLHGSWYGHYKGALDNPFPDAEQTNIMPPEEPTEFLTDFKPRQIPKALVNGIRQVLFSYPDGISLSELRSELKRNNIVLEKDYFGHRKFSHLLLSMPNILKFKFNPGDTQPLVHGLHQRSVSQSEPNSKPSAVVASKSSGGDGKSFFLPRKATEKHFSLESDLSTSFRNSTDADGPHIATSAEESLALCKGADGVTIHQKDDVTASCKEVDKKSGESQSSKKQNEEISTSEGIFGGLWKKLMGKRRGSAKENTNKIESGRASGVVSENIGGSSPEEMQPGKCIDRPNLNQNSISLSSLSGKDTLYSNIDVMEDKDKIVDCPPVPSGNSLDSGTAVKQDENSPKSGLFSHIFEWFRSWKASSRASEKLQGNISEYVNQSVEGQGPDQHGICWTNVTLPGIQAEHHNLFSKPHFWDSMESFLGTSKGSGLISKSRTREELMRGLQREGPLVLTALKEGHLCQLVNLLIAEKKWLEESTSQAYPFKLMLPTKRVCVPSHANGVNGLRSIFSDKIFRSNSEATSKQSTRDQPWNPSSGSLEGRVPKGIAELRDWFSRIHESSDSALASEDYERRFEGEFGRKLDSLVYGYFTVDDLVAACSVEAESSPRSVGSCPKISRADTLSDCKMLLTDFLEHHPSGFNIGLFRPMFFKRYSYVLDYQALGYPKLASLLQIMPGVRIESSLVLPAEALHPDSADQKAVNGAESEVWDELGPLSGCDGGRGETAEGWEVSEAEASDPQESTRKRAHGRSKNVSALLEVLDGYYSRQREQGGGREDRVLFVEGQTEGRLRAEEGDGGAAGRTQVAEQPVDFSVCGGSSAEASDLPTRKRSISFVSDSKEEEESASSLVGKVRKPGDSRSKSKLDTLGTA